MSSEDKERLLVEIEHRIMEMYGCDALLLEQIILDTIYDERQRLEKEKNREKAATEKKFYDRIQPAATRGDLHQMRQILREMTRYFFDGIVGHFDERVYALSTNVVPPALSVLLNSVSPMRMLRVFRDGFKAFDDQLVIRGEVEALRRAASKGTTILVSTHQSNLDSIILGFALHTLGLPPYTYGAGLNLFSNKMIGFFMHNLGAYKVDRLKKAELYKTILKIYAGCTIELGYHNMFFPGGTRIRNGMVEPKLKKGLLGMGLNAYIHNLKGQRSNPDVFVVPCTLNYQLVLEAETLIEDHLKEVGKSRYIIEDDEFSKPKVVLDFVRKLFSLDSSIYLTISKPLDVFGNEIDEECRSIDKKGRIIDRVGYVCSDGEVNFDSQRDQQYTEELEESVIRAFHNDSVVNTTRILCYVAFNWLLRNNPGMDFYRLLRTGGEKESIPQADIYNGVETVLDKLKEKELKGEVKLSNILKTKDVVTIVNDALLHLKTFHKKPALLRKGDRYFLEDRNLLLYYRNRLASYNLEKGDKPL